MKLRQIIISFIAIIGIFIYSTITSFAITPQTHENNRFQTSLPKSDFSTTDNPQINIQEKIQQKSFFLKLIPKFIYTPPTHSSLKSTLKVVVKDSDNQKLDDINPIIEEINGEIIVSLDKSQLKPGRYSFEISADTGSTIVQNFTWGVLSLNPDKTPYSIGDTAFLAMAVLDDYGKMVCNASLTLTITKPDNSAVTLSTTNGQITKNDVCHTKDVTLIPDYQALYNIDQIGIYHYTLTAATQKGSYSISDSFSAQNNPDFVINRLASTRIYPPNTYPVILKITTNRDFSGTIIENVPSSFQIINTTAKITTQNDRKILTWDISLSKGQTTSLKYSYLAPPVSPQRYLLGPLNFIQQGKTVFTESRSWQIASDAPSHSNGILLWTNETDRFAYKVWDGTQFGAGTSSPALLGYYYIRQLASAVTDDGKYVGVVAEATDGYAHVLFGTVWDSQNSTWIDTTQLWDYYNNTGPALRDFNIAAISNTEFVVVSANDDYLTTLNNAGWLAGTGWTVETDLTTIGGIAMFVDMVRRPGTSNLLLCTTDDQADSNCRYYKGALPYGPSADVNDDWTSNTELMTVSDSANAWDLHSFFDTTDNTRGAVIMNANSAVSPNIRAQRFTVTDSTITYGNTADSDPMSSDFNKNTVLPIPGQSSALVAAVDIFESFRTYNVDVSTTTPAWTTLNTIAPDASMHGTDANINYNWAAEFDGTRSVLSWSKVGTTNPVFFNTLGIGETFTPQAAIPNSPNNGYNRIAIARRDPIVTDEIIFVRGNDDVDIITVWWDGSANSFYSSGNKSWTEQQSSITTSVAPTHNSIEFQFFTPPNNPPNTPTNSTPANGATAVDINPTLTSTAFSDPNDSDTHQASQWQISTDSGFSSVVWDSSATTSLTSINVVYTLSDNTLYYWHLRHQDDLDSWSNYSVGTSFTTIDIPSYLKLNGVKLNGIKFQ